MSVDVNKPVENPKLSALLKEFHTAEGSKRMELQEQIAEELAMNAHLLAVVNFDHQGMEEKDGTAVFQKDTRISFVMFSDPNKTSYLPVYTDWKAISENKDYRENHVDTFILSFDDMSAITSGKAGIVINPFSDNFIITPDNVVHIRQHKDSITKGYTTTTVQEETKVLLGDPADYPNEMAEAIRQSAKTNKDIKAIWLKLMVRNNEKSHLLIVDHTGDRNTVFSAIAKAAASVDHRGLPIDMVAYTDQFGRDAAKGEPLYRRKKLFGIL
ncbi:MAG: enhanced serine sensitivity protein SseB [Solobacterium sp.]|nr:enhanced serine sensitivity protein SseB [Solobacterium sp.]